MSETKPARVQPGGDLVEADLYDDLLCRYERALVYAGELREKLRGKEELEREFQELKKDTSRLEKSVAVDEAYIRLLEHALESLGILSSQPSESAERSLPTGRGAVDSA